MSNKENGNGNGKGVGGFHSEAAQTPGTNVEYKITEESGNGTKTERRAVLDAKPDRATREAKSPFRWLLTRLTWMSVTALVVQILRAISLVSTGLFAPASFLLMFRLLIAASITIYFAYRWSIDADSAFIDAVCVAIGFFFSVVGGFL